MTVDNFNIFLSGIKLKRGVRVIRATQNCLFNHLSRTNVAGLEAPCLQVGGIRLQNKALLR